mgnify:CR=1 FL=1
MTRLTLLLLLKIGFTAITVVAPFLLLPADRVAEMIGALEPAPSLYRLYGVAILALLVGYSSAVPTAQRGELPRGIISMGLVSNGGAATTLFAYGASGTSVLLAVVFAAIAFALLTTLLVPDLMLRTLTGRHQASA